MTISEMKATIRVQIKTIAGEKRVRVVRNFAL